MDHGPPQLLQAYDDFHAKYPDGEINKEQFMEVSKVKMIIWASADNYDDADVDGDDGAGDDYDKYDIDSGGGGDADDDDRW